MINHIMRTLTAWLLLFGACGCSPKAPSPAMMEAPSIVGNMLALSNTAQLKQIISIGTETNAVLRLIGKPWLITDEGEGTTVWRYHVKPFPADDDMVDTDVILAVLSFTNGRVARIGYAYAGHQTIKGKDEAIPAASSNGSRSNTLEVFLARSTREEGDKAIPGQDSASVCYIPGQPALVVKRFLDLRIQENTDRMPDGNNRKAWSFTFELCPEDSKLLASLTRDSIGKSLVMMCSNTFIANVRLWEPIETGRVMLTIVDEERIGSIRALLSGVPR